MKSRCARKVAVTMVRKEYEALLKEMNELRAVSLFLLFLHLLLQFKLERDQERTRNIKSKLTDEHLKSLLIIGTSKISPQLQTIVSGKSQLHKSH
ncbi:hypothetical protein O3M35_010333 [Rhynocoris fuscipes]|uniref:Uncharacterized protein n=1 Tax=Rhynocoris fuscipes TaxID=488301 RepID=A0AAW1D695_9HEMI